MPHSLHACDSAQDRVCKGREEDPISTMGPDKSEDPGPTLGAHPRATESTLRLSKEEIAAYVDEMKSRAPVDDADDRAKTIRVDMREILGYRDRAKKPAAHSKAERPTHTRPVVVLVGIGFIAVTVCAYLFF